MATYTATAATAEVTPRHAAQGLVTKYCKYTISATTSAGDVIQMIKIPKGASVVDLKFLAASTGVLLFDVGDGVDPNRYIVGATGSAAAAGVNLAASAAFQNYIYSATEDTIDVTLGTVSTSGSGGYLAILVTYGNDVR